MIQTSHYCATCQRKTLHTKPRVNHVLHLILSVLTAGLWVLVWVTVGANNASKRTRCGVCGSKPGLQSLKHQAGFGPAAAVAAAPSSSVVEEIAPSTWLPPGARPPR